MSSSLVRRVEFAKSFPVIVEIRMVCSLAREKEKVVKLRQKRDGRGKDVRR